MKSPIIIKNVESKIRNSNNAKGAGIDNKLQGVLLAAQNQYLLQH